MKHIDNRSASGARLQPVFDVAPPLNQATKRPRDLFPLFAVLFLFVFGLIAYGVYKEKQQNLIMLEPAGEPYVIGAFTVILNGDTDNSEIKDPKVLAELKWAVDTWEQALGVPLAVPKIFMRPVSGSTCGEGAWACADVVSGNISIIGNPTRDGYPLRHVLLHEIGHILGVPHIETDELMHPTTFGGYYTGTRVTPAATALAKLYHAWDGKQFPLRVKE